MVYILNTKYEKVCNKIFFNNLICVSLKCFIWQDVYMNIEIIVSHLYDHKHSNTFLSTHTVSKGVIKQQNMIV